MLIFVALTAKSKTFQKDLHFQRGSNVIQASCLSSCFTVSLLLLLTLFFPSYLTL